MSVLLRSLSGLFLAMILTATSLTMAVARGQTLPVDQIVICHGMGVATVLVDAEGNPTGPAHLCPESALSLFAAVTDLPPPPMPHGVWYRTQTEWTTVQITGRDAPAATARGPPLMV